MSDTQTEKVATSTEKIPTAGAKFFDLRYQPVKLVEVLHIPEKDIVFKKGDEVLIAGSNGTVYGPYLLDTEFSRGGGTVIWKAYKSGTDGKTRKPLTKAELEQEAAAKDLEIANLRKQLAQGKK